MKCLICDSINSPSRQYCSECNAPLPRNRKSIARTDPPAEDSARLEAHEVPEWRREVSAKVRAYGERKKRLTTPPHSWKESEEKEITLAESPPEEITFKAEKNEELPSENHRSPVPTRAPAAPPQSQSIEVWNKDLANQQHTGGEETAAPLFLLRRALAFIIDNTIIVVLLSGLISFLSWAIKEHVGSFFVSGWRIWLPLSGLCHFLYYLYFYKTSRQTPGLVFVSLEIRDPSNPEISVLKIFLRWAAMMLLNVLNLLPVIAGRKSLVLDDLSGTCVRSMK